MLDEVKMQLLKLDLQRIGKMPDEPLLESYLRAAASNLARQGVRDDSSEDYIALLIGTAAWMYRKRISGEVEPRYLRRMRLDMKYGKGGEPDA